MDNKTLRALNYIRKLENRNRMKKLHRENSMTGEQKQKERLRRGFTVNFSGANTKRVDKLRKREAEKRKNNKVGYIGRRRVVSKLTPTKDISPSVDVKRRKKWRVVNDELEVSKEESILSLCVDSETTMTKRQQMNINMKTPAIINDDDNDDEDYDSDRYGEDSFENFSDNEEEAIEEDIDVQNLVHEFRKMDCSVNDFRQSINILSKSSDDLRKQKKGTEGRIGHDVRVSQDMQQFVKRTAMLKTSQKRVLLDILDSLEDHNSVNGCNERNEEKEEHDQKEELRIEDQSILDAVFNDISMTMDDTVDLSVSVERSVVPSLPCGERLEIEIFSNWGDCNFIGLTGIDFYDEYGRPIRSKKEKIFSVSKEEWKHHARNKARLGNLYVTYNHEEESNSTVNNDLLALCDGINRTTDGKHMWKAQNRKGNKLKLGFLFPESKRISMINVYNYNKSRVHSSIGVQRFSIILNEVEIYSGELMKANGNMANGNWISFTKDKVLVERIKTMEQDKDLRMSTVMASLTYEQLKVMKSESRRPCTADDDEEEPGKKLGYHQKAINIGPRGVPKCRYVEIDLLSTWGDPYYIGLCGIEFYTYGDEKQHQQSIPIVLHKKDVFADPPDLNINGHRGDPRTVDKLLDRCNNTCDDRHMWLIPFTDGASHILRFDFGSEIPVNGFKVWNYNRNPKDTSRGVRDILIKCLDKTGKICVFETKKVLTRSSGRAFHLRKHFSGSGGAQWISLSSERKKTCLDLYNRPQSVPSANINGSLLQDYVTPQIPSGMSLNIRLLSNWGDPFYIGLDGIEILDSQGNVLDLNNNQFFATYCVPDSVNLLLQNGDSRIPSNLFKKNPQACWLAPLSSSLSPKEKTAMFGVRSNPNDFQVNEIHIRSDQSFGISAIRIWNYSQTPKRGVQEIEVCFDGNIIYQGFLSMKSTTASMNAKNEYQTVLFTSDLPLLRQEGKNTFYCGSFRQAVLCINDNQVMREDSTLYSNRSYTGPQIDIGSTKRVRPSTSRQESPDALK